MRVTLINGCSLRSTCGSVHRTLSRTKACGSYGMRMSFMGDRALASSGMRRTLGKVSNMVVNPKFNRHNVSNGFMTVGCAHARGVPAFNVYLNVRYVTVRFTHGILKCGSTGSHRVSRGAPRGIVSVVRRRGTVAGVKKAVHLNTCRYALRGNDGTCRTCGARRVRRHRHRHCRFGGSFGARCRTTNVGYANVGPRSNLMRVMRVPTLG